MMRKGETMNALVNYCPSITILPGKDKTAYMKLMREQLTPEMAELLIDITTAYYGQITDELKGNPRLQLFFKLMNNLDGELINE